MELKIEYLSKEELKPYANNAKIHTAEQVEQIKKSIEEFGFNDPIAIWHENEIIEGHGRLLAVMEMDDITEVPVIRLDDLTDTQRKAYMLAHNKLTMNTNFDNGILSLELDDIIGEIDMTQLGFSEFEISMITGDFAPDEYDEDLLSEYDEHAEEFLAKKRVMITYAEGQEELIANLLGTDKDKLKVVYDISEIIKKEDKE